MHTRTSYEYPSKLVAIAWLLIGLMVAGSLVDYWAARATSSMCAESRVLELEDDRSDVQDVLSLQPGGTLWLSPPTFFGDVPRCRYVDFWSALQAAHLERGPPARFC
ncbi:MAG: hypothetical protein IT423_13070 [Pirellulaceae bacterium]|nr:hypothetical protein [Pirellulaceae bacterium]